MSRSSIKISPRCQWSAFWLCLCLGGIPLLASAEQGPHAKEEQETIRIDPALGLAQVIAAAVARAPGAESIEARSTEQRALQQRADAWLPLPLELSLRYQSGQPTGDDRLREYEAGIALPLWRWGERASARELATHSGAQQSALTLQRQWQVAGQVREAIWQVHRLQARLTQATQARDAAQTLANEVDLRIAAGDVPARDRLSVQALVLSRETERHAASVEWVDALVEYRLLTGLDSLPAPVAEQQATDQGRDIPLVFAARAAVARATADLANLRAGGAGNPRVLIGVRSETDITGLTVDSIGTNLSIPFGGTTARRAREAPLVVALAEQQAMLAAAEREQTRMRHEVEHALHAAEKTLELTESAVMVTERELSLAQRAFALGEMDLVERLQIEARAQQARQQAVLARLEQQRAVARYNQIFGVLP